MCGPEPMVTAWVYPEKFYTRLAKHWPELSFICSVNEQMGSFGGIVMVLDGKVTDLVRDYRVRGYSRAAHARQVRAAIKRWAKITSGGRDWRVIAHHPWDRGRMPFDAHLDDDFWFYFKTREEMMRFRKHYRTSRPQRRLNGEWKRTR